MRLPSSAEALLQRERVEQSLGGMLVHTVAGVDDRRSGAISSSGPFGDLPGRTRSRMPHDQRVGAGRVRRLDGVAQHSRSYPPTNSTR